MLKPFDRRGETLVELLITTMILSLVLFVLIAVWMSGRSGVEKSWTLTRHNEVAVQLMEQLKATPYTDLLEWEQQFQTDGQAVGLDPGDNRINLTVPQDFEASFDLLPYEDYPLTVMMKVVVRVRIISETDWVEKASIIANR